MTTLIPESIPSLQTAVARPRSCDIFCNVIDNYGDIGVSWRLARQLAGEYGVRVRLWVDDLPSFAKLCPEADAARAAQTCCGVEVRHWGGDFAGVTPAELVIDAFGCKLPEAYLAAMGEIAIHSERPAKMGARRQALADRDSTKTYSEEERRAGTTPDVREPVWVNLEYLSAEDWVEGCHRLPSPRPPLTRYFFFPGFTRRTGGLLLERDLLARRDAFMHDAARQRAFWASIGLAESDADTLKVSLFAYENDALPGLFDAWAVGAQPVLCLVPEGRILPQAGRYFGDDAPSSGRHYRRGSLEVCVVPFVRQEDYDELLWACDVNFVRGEDSCVRAQWAGKPFVWQIYPQDDGVHWEKLQAFLDRFGAALKPAARQALQGLWRAWNGTGGAGAAWADFAAVRGELDERAADWALELSSNNLALNLLDFFGEVGTMRAFKIEGQ